MIHRPINSLNRISDLYVNYQGWLISLLKQRLGCSQTAGDLSQDVFERLLKKQQLPTIHEPRAFLAKIAYGLTIDYWRRASLEQAWLEYASQQAPEYEVSAEEQAVVIDSLANVDAMLKSLTARERQVFLMSRIEGYSYQKIASLLDVSLSSVEKDMAKVLRHCYQLLLG